ncbi:hypothetical protein [Paraburkholderia dipogonis]|uniref:hypothetical protein n=1 Tax=Paraburkholderia dipogonis TaxID=1211383 RepID=UPI0038BC8A50
MTARRYEGGRLVDEKRVVTPTLGWGKKDDESLAAMPVPQADAAGAEASEEPSARLAPAKVVRRPPPVVVAEHAPVAALPVAPKEPTHPAPPPAAKPPVDDEQIEDTSDMRKFLLKQMVRAANGAISTETVKNIVTLSQQVYNATSLELKAAAILKNTDKSIRALELVSPQDRVE